MMGKKKLATFGLAAVVLFATLAFGAGWRTYENSIWLGDPSTAGDRNIYFEIGNAPTNPGLRWDESETSFTIANDGTTFLRIPQAAAALTASEALVTNGSGVLTTQTGVSATEVGYLSTVTSDIQTQLNGTVKTTGDQTVAGAKTFTSGVRVKEGESGVGAAGDFGVVIESDENVILGFYTPNDKFQSIEFGDPEDNNRGSISYNHNDSSMAFINSGSPRLTFSSTGQATFANSIRATAGAASDPSYGFSADSGTNTGMFRSAEDEVAFSTAGSARVTIKSNGRVGIGVTDPSHLVTIAGANTQTVLVIENNTDMTAVSSGNRIAWTANTEAVVASIETFVSNVDGSTDMQFAVRSGVAAPIIKFEIRSNGDFRVTDLGTGDVDATNGVLGLVSDERLKKDIVPFKRGLEAILKIEPKTFFWNEKSGYDTNIKKTGFIAQQIEQYIPEAVTNDRTDGMKGFSSRAVLATAVNAIKELKAENDLLKEWVCSREDAPETICDVR